jgi:phenylalanyl-tRNA synthetase beta chain
MRINLDWLKEYASFDFSASELADKLTMTSLESVPLLEKNDFLSNVEIGRVTSVEQHPNADKLSLCTVNTGNGSDSQIICGAPNVAEGQRVPVITPGSVMPSGDIIESVELRGVESHGMIASEKELGLSDAHAGIMVLRDDAEIGGSFWDYLERFWAGLDVEITPNRPDCMSHFGVAREAAILAGNDFSRPDIQITETGEIIDTIASIKIHDAVKCPRYAARVIKNVTIEPSPLWMQQRLSSIGLRPINNIVDISNYVLMETGHPLHTFDYDTLADHTIEVRTAATDEKFTTLDGKERTLNDEILLICDAEKPVALAGIMGGENSEVTADTTNILIESAYFDPTTIRRGSKFLGLSTEASKRFERGTDPEGVVYALNRITELIQEIAGGEVAKGVLDEYPEKQAPVKLQLRTSRTNEILGVDLTQNRINGILTDLGFETERLDKDTLQVGVPTFRPDIEREIDLIEEVLRIHGMWKVPAPHHFTYGTQDTGRETASLETRLREIWKGFGFNHTFSNSLVKKEYTYPDVTDLEPVRVANPLGEEMAYMRTTLIPLLLEAVKKNQNRQERDIRLLEYGRVFEKNSHSETHANEYVNVCAIATGYNARPSWAQEEKEIDFYDFKGYIEVMLEVIGLSGCSFKQFNSEFFAPGFQLVYEGHPVAHGGQFDSELTAQFDIDSDVYGFEFNIDAVRNHVATEAHYSKPSDFPPVERDLSFVVPENVQAADLSATLHEAGGDLLTDLLLYDLYDGEQIPEDKKSLTYSLKFLSKERTLREEEIDAIIERMLDMAKKRHTAILREE